MNYLEALLKVTAGEMQANDDLIVDLEKRTTQNVRRVPPRMPASGRPRLAFIGDAPTEIDVQTGKPFSSVIGDELRHWCREVGIDFDEAYLDYVYPFQGWGRLSEEAQHDERLSAQERTRGALDRAYKEGDHTIVVALGEEALRVFSGYEGITKYRGNVFTYPLDPQEGALTSTVATLDPLAVLRDSSLRRRCLFDMGRVKKLLDEGYTQPKKRKHSLMRVDGVKSKLIPPGRDYGDLFALSRNSNCYMAIDIETAALDDRITCIGFGLSSTRSLVVEWPLSSDQSARANFLRDTVKKLCESPCQKVLQNGLYDAWWLKQYAGIELTNWIWDTMGMAQVWCPTDNLSLQYLTSILTNIPYYKDEGKDHFGRAPKSDDGWEQLMTYCGLDACATLEVFYELRERLAVEKKTWFYRSNYPPKFKPMLDLMTHGVRIDNDARCAEREGFLERSRDARDALVVFNGGEPMFTLTTQRDAKVYDALRAAGNNRFVLYGRVSKTANTLYTDEEIEKSLEVIDAKTMSSAKLKTLLYDKMGIPVQYERRAGGIETPTVGDLTLRKLYQEYASQPDVRQVIRLAMDHNKAHKLAEFCYDNMVDEDGRMRFSLKFTPETGRFASSKAPNGRGKNSQNLPRDKRIRRLVLPEPGHVLVKADMSQVEARFCFMYTRDPELVRLANLTPDEYDQHSENAVILGLAQSADNVSGEARQLAKAVVHGAQRNMQAQTLQDTLLKGADIDGDLIIPTLGECENLLESYHTRYPAIRGVFFEETRRAMQTKRKLVNSWGREWGLPHHDLDEEAMRRAFSFLLQSEAADLINRWGFLYMWDDIQHGEIPARIMLHAHDELVFSCPPSGAHTAMRWLSRYLSEPRMIQGNNLSVPLEFGIGKSWAVEYGWKKLPTEEEINEALEKMLE